jgi:glutamate--cysteine ligase
MSSHQHGSSDHLDKNTLLDATIKAIVGAPKVNEAKKIGLEIEIPFVDAETLKPLPFKGHKSISAMFNSLCAKGWQGATVENGNTTSLKSDIGNVMLEPGGQIEFASLPRKNLAALTSDVAAYLAHCQSAGKELAIDALPFGFHPHIGIEECPYISERSRFAALKPVFESEKGFSAWGQSSSVQVTLEEKTPEAAFAAFKLGLALQPIAAAMCANSPFAKSQDSGFQSWRRQSLLALHSPLYEVPSQFFDADFGFNEWAKHILSVPMSFIVRDQKYISVAPHAFQDMVGKPLPELSHLPVEQQYLTQTDLLDHITGIKPEMLLKPNLLLEFRAADLGPTPEYWMGLAAFWTGIFYDPQSFAAAQALVASWPQGGYAELRQNVAKDGLNANFAGVSAQDTALALLNIAKEGLQRQEPAAVALLDVFFKNVAEGKTPAMDALKQFRENNADMTATLKQSLLFSPVPKAQTLKI